MENVSIDELEKIQEANEDPSITKLVDIILTAINDWPTPIDDLKQYELEVAGFIGKKITKEEITKERIKTALSQIDYSRDAWKGESISELIEIFEFYHEGISLHQIIKEIISYF